MSVVARQVSFSFTVMTLFLCGWEYTGSMAMTAGNACVDARTLVLRAEEFQVHDVASVLRRFIRSLDEPLLTEALRSRWIETSSTLTCVSSPSSCSVYSAPVIN